MPSENPWHVTLTIGCCAIYHLSRRALNKENKTSLAIIKVMIPVALVICRCVEDFNSGQPNTYSASGEVEDLHPGPPHYKSGALSSKLADKTSEEVKWQNYLGYSLFLQKIWKITVLNYFKVTSNRNDLMNLAIHRSPNESNGLPGILSFI